MEIDLPNFQPSPSSNDVEAKSSAIQTTNKDSMAQRFSGTPWRIPALVQSGSGTPEPPWRLMQETKCRGDCGPQEQADISPWQTDRQNDGAEPAVAGDHGWDVKLWGPLVILYIVFGGLSADHQRTITFTWVYL